MVSRHNSHNGYRRLGIAASVVVFFVFGVLPLRALPAQAAPEPSPGPTPTPAASTSTDQQSTPPKRTKRVEVPAGRTEYKTLYLNPDNTYTAEISQAPVHYKDASGKYQNISTDVTDTGDQLVADKTLVHTKLVKAPGSGGEVAAFELSDRTVTMRLKNASLSSQSQQDPLSVLPKTLTNGQVFTSAFNNVDAEYTVTAAGLKEALVLSSANAPSTFVSELQVDNARAKVLPSGAVAFTDAPTGKFLFMLPKAFMYDNAYGAQKDQTTSTAHISNSSQTASSHSKPP